MTNSDPDIDIENETDREIGGEPLDVPRLSRPQPPPELLVQRADAAHDFRYSTFIRERDIRDMSLTTSFVPDPSDRDGDTKQHDAITAVFVENPHAVMHLGYLAAHRQRWLSAGTALGDIVYNLSLAPGESRSVAMIDLRRHQQHRSQRQDATAPPEQLLFDHDHTFAVQQVAAAVAWEHQCGKTMIEANTHVTGGAFVAAGALGDDIATGPALDPRGGPIGDVNGAAGGGLVFAGAQAIGMVEAESSGDRVVMARTSKRIAQSTSQQSATIRSLWSTVVTEDVREEQFGVRASSITNHHQMSALNMEYYEILHRYDTAITLERVVPVLYLPFAALDLDDVDLIDEFWNSIRLGLPAGLRSKGDTVFAEPPPPVFVPEPLPTLPSASTATFTGLRIEVEVEWGLEMAEVIGAAVPAVALARSNLATLGLGAVIGALALASDEIVRDVGLDLELTGNRLVSMTPLNRVDDTGAGTTTFPFHLPFVDAAEIVGVRLEMNSPTDLFDSNVNVRLSVASVTVGGNNDLAIAGTQISSGTVRTLDQTGRRAGLTCGWIPFASEQQAHAAALGAVDAVALANAEGQAAHDALLAQLATWRGQVVAAVQREQYRFTRIVLSAIEPGRLTHVLDRLHLACGEEGAAFAIPLHRLVDTTPIGVTDDSLVLRMKDVGRDTARRWVGSPEPQDRDAELSAGLAQVLSWPAQLAERFEDLTDLGVEDVIHLPVAGVFAQAVLGRSNGDDLVRSTSTATLGG